MRAWQPFTFGGVAGIGRGSFFGLLVLESVFALVVAVGMTLAIHLAWEPLFNDLIGQLPESGLIEDGRLQWPDEGQTIALEGNFLALGIVPRGELPTSLSADVMLTCGSDAFRFASQIGYLDVAYPSWLNIPLNNKVLAPWWEAWRLALMVGCVAALAVSMLVMWSVLGLLYAMLPFVLSYFSKNKCSYSQGWKLASASLLTPSLIVGIAAVLYGMALINVILLVFFYLTHVVVGWVYLLVSSLIAVFGASQVPSEDRDGPFSAKRKPSNPFS
jgi:hypothetical protein